MVGLIAELVPHAVGIDVLCPVRRVDDDVASYRAGIFFIQRCRYLVFSDVRQLDDAAEVHRVLD